MPTPDTPSTSSAEQIVFHNGPPPAADAPERDKAAAMEGTAHGIILPNEEDVLVGTPGCQHCEVLPKPLRGPGTVSLRLPHTYSLGKVLSYLTTTSWEHSEHNGTLSIRVPSGSLAPLLSPIMDRLSSVEQRDTKAIFQADGQLTVATDYYEIDALPRFAAKARAAWLLDILRQKRLRSVFQPILRPAETGDAYEVHGYECLLRAEADGRPVPPLEMLEMARRAGLLFQLDLAARRSSLLAAEAQRVSQKVFVNFSPNAIYNPKSCLDSTVRQVDEAGLRRDQVVFEIIEGDRLPETPHLRRIVDYYHDHGFGVALDDVGTGYSSLEILLALRPDYAKLDMGLTRGVHADPARALLTGKLLEALQGLGICSVAEGIETPEELAWVRAHGVDLVQGYLFARPDAVPPLR